MKDEKDVRVHVFTLCWNEMNILPFVVDYWKQYAEHVTVFDNGSTDGSVEYLKQFDFITVKSFETEGFNDVTHMIIKNECWKGCDADFVVVCDIDEMPLGRNIKESFMNMKKAGATICKPTWFEFLAKKKPVYEKGKLLHEISPMARPYQEYSKAIIFSPKNINEINYGPGAHKCKPNGCIRWYTDGDIYALHINHNLSLEYKLNRYKILNERLSDVNKEKGYGIQYAFTNRFIRKEWSMNSKRLVNLNEVLQPLMPEIEIGQLPMN